MIKCRIAVGDRVVISESNKIGTVVDKFKDGTKPYYVLHDETINHIKKHELYSFDELELFVEKEKSVICGMQSKIEKQRKEIVRLNRELKWKQQTLNRIQLENNNKLLNGIDPKDYELVITSNEDNTEYYNNGVKVDKLNYIKFESEVGSVPIVITRRYVIKDNK